MRSDDEPGMVAAPRQREAPASEQVEGAASLASALDVMPAAVRMAVEPLLQLEQVFGGYMGDDPDGGNELVWPRVDAYLRAAIAIDDALERAGIMYPKLLGGVEQLIEQRDRAVAELDGTKADLRLRDRAYFELRQDATRQVQAFTRRIGALEFANRGYRAEVDRLYQELQSRRWWRRRKPPKAPAAD